MKEKEATSEETELLYQVVRDHHLLAPVVMIGASALIPVPFLDDVAKEYLEKRLFRDIAAKEGLVLSKEEQKHLTQEKNGGCCALGCLGSALIYPLKKLLRKILYFLEIKRSVDQATTALAQAWLFELTLRRKLWVPGGEIESCHKVRRAIREACTSHGVKPLELAVKQAFSGAKGTMLDLAGRFSRETASNEDTIAQTVDQLESEQEENLKGITRKLSESLNDISESYLVRFGVTFEKHLAEEMARPEPETLA
ncbi:MAG: hypothetical protein WC314_21420 [Vulcanimicrobiota bacterium]